MRHKILLVEDESDLALIIADTLSGNGYDVVTARDGAEGVSMFLRYTPDIIVADVMMPRMDGFTMARKIRKTASAIPIIFMTAKSSIDDVEQGFESGADDYIRKPFELRELIVRIKRLLDRTTPRHNQECGIGKYTFDSGTQTLRYENEEVVLSNFEARVLEMLSRNTGRTVDASAMMMSIWQRDDESNRNSLHGYIHKLRKMLRHDPTISIINQRGFGYMLCINKR